MRPFSRKLASNPLPVVLRATVALAAVATSSWTRAALASDQFVVVDETYTATAQNTSDSHYRIPPRPGTPTNWRSPIDYASGSVHVRFEVLSKPSMRKTLYNVCFEGNNASCMGYPPPYETPGVYDFEFPFSTFWQYALVDWSQPINELAFILKDENGTKVPGDPEFYPTTIHVTMTVIPPGETYEPPPPSTSDAGPAGTATADASAASSFDAGPTASGSSGAGTPTPSASGNGAASAAAPAAGASNAGASPTLETMDDSGCAVSGNGAARARAALLGGLGVLALVARRRAKKRAGEDR